VSSNPIFSASQSCPFCSPAALSDRVLVVGWERTKVKATNRTFEVGLSLPSNKVPAGGSWHEAARNVVYMLFLGLESARHAIADLVEFEPEKAERTIVILISELEAYRFLSSQFTEEHEVHHERIMLRDSEYRHLVPELCRSVKAGRDSEKAGTESHEPRQVSLWEPAWRLLPELKERYQAAMGSIIL